MRQEARVYGTMDSPIGELTLIAGGAGLESIHFHGAWQDSDTNTEIRRDHDALAPYMEALTGYFDGRMRSFELPLSFPSDSSPFNLDVWNQLQAIPYGETRSYGQIAESLGRPGAARAVGMANHRNPLPIVVPCHRVVGSNGSLVGYAGGVEAKAKLLALERKNGSA